MIRFTIRRYDSVASTNDEARRLAAADAAEGTAVLAREQTSGRGRQGRHWISPPGNLHLSLLLRPAIPARRGAELGFLTAVAVADTVDALLLPHRRAMLKWPNDLLVNGSKLAGILIESELGPDAIAWTIIGVGVNIAYSPADALYPVTSLSAEGVTTDVDSFGPALLERMAAWLERWTADGFEPVRAAWLARAHPLGETIRVGEVTGRFAGLDEDGALLLITPSGTRRIRTGDVAFGTHL